MTLSIAVLLAVLVVMAVLFFTEKLPIELTAFLGLVFLVFGGYIEPGEAFSGFSSPAVITMLSIFFVSAAMLHTGVADMIGSRVHKWIGNREVLLVIAIMVVAGVLSAFMNNVAAVAVLLPAIAALSRKAGIAPSRLFMPLSFGAILGGTMTLVGTPPNILAGDLLREAGLEPFGLFDYTPIGAVLLAVGVVYMITVGRWMLPRRAVAEDHRVSGDDLVRVYNLKESMFSVRIPPDSGLVGTTLAESQFGSALDAQVVGIVRNGRRELAPTGDTILEADDTLIVEGKLERVQELLQVQDVDVDRPGTTFVTTAWGQVGLVSLQLTEDCPLVGQTLKDAGFRGRFGSVVLAIRRGETMLDGAAGDVTLEIGDELLTAGLPSEEDQRTVPDGVMVTIPDPEELADLRSHLVLLRIHAGSPLVGTRIQNSQLHELVGLTVAGIQRDDKMSAAVRPQERIRSGDQLLVVGDPERIRTLVALGDVQLQKNITGAGLESDDVGIVEVTLAPRSRIRGQTLAQLDFRDKYGLQVLALGRKGVPIQRDLAHIPLQFGDALLVQGSWTKIRHLGSNRDYMVLSPAAQEPRRTRKAWIAVGSLLVMVGLVVSGFMPIQVAAFTAACLVVLFGAITMEEAYRSVEWKAVFLVAAILPMGIALERTGAAQLASDGITTLTGPYGPYAAMAGLFTLASALSQALDGAPAVVMMTPVVLDAAAQLDINPRALMMGVSLAASAAFMTPFSHKANLLVMGSGGYRTTDYLKLGTPLTILLLFLMVVLVPVFFPL
jgi:di/tricarboxylate transporter